MCFSGMPSSLLTPLDVMACTDCHPDTPALQPGGRFEEQMPPFACLLKDG